MDADARTRSGEPRVGIGASLLAALPEVGAVVVVHALLLLGLGWALAGRSDALGLQGLELWAGTAIIPVLLWCALVLSRAIARRGRSAAWLVVAAVAVTAGTGIGALAGALTGGETATGIAIAGALLIPAALLVALIARAIAPAGRAERPARW